jgi:hypothetical protein
VRLKGLGAKTNWLAVNRQSWNNFDFNFDKENRLVVRVAVQREQPLSTEAVEGIRNVERQRAREDTANWEGLACAAVIC